MRQRSALGVRMSASGLATASRAWSACGAAAALVIVVGGMVGVLPAAARGAQRVDRSKSPTLEASAGGFTIRRLSGPVTVDGRTWVAVTKIMGTQTVQAPNGEFTLSLAEPNDEGDVRRFRLALAERGGKPVALTADVVSYAFVTSDSRWIFFEPIDVIDVRAWRRYGLSQAFGIQPYVVPEAISADGRRLIIARRDCPFDCRGLPTEYYEIGFPAR
jgi:hypothetical protein